MKFVYEYGIRELPFRNQRTHTQLCVCVCVSVYTCCVLKVHRVEIAELTHAHWRIAISKNNFRITIKQCGWKIAKNWCSRVLNPMTDVKSRNHLNWDATPFMTKWNHLLDIDFNFIVFFFCWILFSIPMCHNWRICVCMKNMDCQWMEFIAQLTVHRTPTNERAREHPHTHGPEKTMYRTHRFNLINLFLHWLFYYFQQLHLYNTAIDSDFDAATFAVHHLWVKLEILIT